MSVETVNRHTCYRCVPHDSSGSLPELESIDATSADSGEKVFFASGYSAREIAERHQREHGGQIYVNSLSRNIRLHDLTVHVAYAVAHAPVYTLRRADALHPAVYRAYWPPLAKESA